MFFLKIKILIQNTSFIFLYHFRLNFIGPIYIKFIICHSLSNLTYGLFELDLHINYFNQFSILVRRLFLNLSIKELFKYLIKKSAKLFSDFMCFNLILFFLTKSLM